MHTWTQEPNSVAKFTSPNSVASFLLFLACPGRKPLLWLCMAAGQVDALDVSKPMKYLEMSCIAALAHGTPLFLTKVTKSHAL